MVEVSASLLAADFANLQRAVEFAEQVGADSFHFDIMDGHYVPNIALAPLHIPALRPHTTLPFHIHLELANPDYVLDHFHRFEAQSLSFQWDCSPDPAATIQRIKSWGAEVSLCLNLEVPLEEALPYLADLSEVLFLGVHPGFGGQKMHAGMPERVAKAVSMYKKINPQLKLAIDGGVNRQNIPALVAAGVDRLIMGSAFYNDPQIADLVHELKKG